MKLGFEEQKKLFEPSQAEKNRKACPITYSMLKEFREIFGDGVTVKKTDEVKNDISN